MLSVDLRPWLVLLSITIAGCSHQPSEETSPEPPLSRAEQLLRQMSDFYGRQKAFRVTGHLQQSAELSDGKLLQSDGDTPTPQTILVQKPNRVDFQMPIGSSDPDSNPRVVRFVSDGKTLSIEIPTERSSEYCTLPAPDTVKGVMIEAMAALDPIAMFAVQLGTDDPAATITEDAVATEYIGEDDLAGVRTHHLQIVNIGQTTCDLWIAAEGNPVVLQSRFLVGEEQVKVNDGEPETANIFVLLHFQDWDFAPAVPDDAFAFTPADGAQQVPTLLPVEEPSPLIGKPAPSIDLALLGTGRLDLSQHRGKEVVVLDFWATWCPPCVAELPSLALIAQEYSDKGVVLYAANQMEDEDTITEFLKKKKLSLNVALDSESQASEAFGAEAFPHLAIVDKNGIVQSVHMGYWPGVKYQLRSELDAILAGRNLFETKPETTLTTPEKGSTTDEASTGPRLPGPLDAGASASGTAADPQP